MASNINPPNIAYPVVLLNYRVNMNLQISELINLCTEGDLNQFKARLHNLKLAGVNTNQYITTPSQGGKTCLIAACRHGWLPIVQFLVEECSVNIEQVQTNINC